MFGVSLGEVMLIAVVALVVFDPRRLPEVLGTAGRWIAKVRRITTEMRRTTGIDEILRQEGISGGVEELRSILRPDLLGAGRYGGAGVVGGAAARAGAGSAVDVHGEAVEFDRYREYPTEGPDAYGAIPEDLLDSPPPTAGAPAELPSRDAAVSSVASVGGASAASAASAASGVKEAG